MCFACVYIYIYIVGTRASETSGTDLAGFQYFLVFVILVSRRSLIERLSDPLMVVSGVVTSYIKGCPTSYDSVTEFFDFFFPH